MLIGVPKEIKNNENRVALTPAGASALINAGHLVCVEDNAGLSSGFSNEDYRMAGAEVMETAASVWGKAEMIIKVKEPLPAEYAYFHKDLLLFTYLHLANEPHLAAALIKQEVTAIAYETIELNRSLPLLIPMSEVAGRMSVQIGAQLLEKSNGGKGILLGGVPGVKRGRVTIIGGGVVGTNAAKIAVGFGAEVTLIDLNADRLRQLDDIFGPAVQTLISSPYHIAESIAESDLVIGAVLIPGAKAPMLVTEVMIKAMKPGSVIIDVAIDQGGIFETIDRVTSHDQPTYVKHGVVHYAVPNMPGAVPRTSTLALTNVTLPYALQVANRGIKRAAQLSPSIQLGVNTANGFITNETVAKELGHSYVPVEEALVRI